MKEMEDGLCGGGERGVTDIEPRWSAGGTRRAVMRQAGGAALLAAAGMLLGARTVLAEVGTPTIDDSDPEVDEGHYLVVRTWTLNPDASATELAALVKEGFVPLLRQTPGFRQYATVWNESTRQWTAITIFVTQAGAEESTANARSWVAANVAGFIAGDPTVFDGQITLFAKAFPPANG